ncbi:MAG: hypothetical protein ACO4AJ_09565 [Prochlorothrix sp.]
MNLSNLLRFLLGVSLGLALLLTGSIAAARYLLEQFTTPPAKPIFAEELPSPSPSPVPVVVASPTPSPRPHPPPPPPAPKTHAHAPAAAAVVVDKKKKQFQKCLKKK